MYKVVLWSNKHLSKIRSWGALHPKQYNLNEMEWDTLCNYETLRTNIMINIQVYSYMSLNTRLAGPLMECEFH